MEQASKTAFEDLKGRLDEIVAAVSKEDLPLDEALDLYEEAVDLGLQASRIMEQGIEASSFEGEASSQPSVGACENVDAAAATAEAGSAE